MTTKLGFVQNGWLRAEMAACKVCRARAAFFTKRQTAAQPGVARRRPYARWTAHASTHTLMPWFAGSKGVMALLAGANHPILHTFRGGPIEGLIERSNNDPAHNGVLA